MFREHCVGFLIRHHRGVVVVIVLAALLLFPLSQQLQFDQTIDSLYARDHPKLRAYQRSKQFFGGQEYIALAFSLTSVFEADGSLREDVAEHLDRVGRQLAAIPGIDADSIQHAGISLRFPYARGKVLDFITGVLIGSDHRTVAVAARLTLEHQTATPRHETFAALRTLAASLNPPAVVVGEPIQIHDMFRYVESDGKILRTWSSIVLIGVLALTLRSPRWILLPYICVELSALFTRATFTMTGFKLSMVSSILHAMIVILAIATMMHLILNYQTMRHNYPSVTALYKTMIKLWSPIFWTIVTTAAGFGALLTSRITPVRSFGIMMCVSCGIIVLMALCIFPIGVLILPERTPATSQPLNTSLSRWLECLSRAILNHPGPTLAALIAVFAFFLAHAWGLPLETDFSKNFRHTSPIVQALELFEARLGGAGTWEVNFPAPEQLDETYLNRVRTLSSRLQQLINDPQTQGLTKLITLTDALDLMPTDLIITRLSLETRLRWLERLQPQLMNNLYNPEQRRMRIMLRALERQSAESKLQLIRQVETISREIFPDAEVAGLYVLLAHLIESLVTDQWVTTFVATGALLLLMSWAQQSALLGALLLVPNTLPIVLTLGCMGLLNMKINIATAMIACVSLGLTVDSTIHYIAFYREMRAQGLNINEAIQATHRSVGLTLVLANIALISGFVVLTLSHFVPLIYFGILVSVAMLGGLWINLIMLPIILVFYEKMIRQAPTP